VAENYQTVSLRRWMNRGNEEGRGTSCPGPLDVMACGRFARS
jgi:hypothetical protein